jgi:rare lipoprotein A
MNLNNRGNIIAAAAAVVLIVTAVIGLVRTLHDVPVTQRGEASWYGPGFHGKKTASGQIYNQNAMTAAHRTLPLGTRVMVTNLENGKQVKVTINDRGPYVKGRIIDLSKAAARKLGFVKIGTVPVWLEVISDPETASK